jgi:hypothetical protein
MIAIATARNFANFFTSTPPARRSPTPLENADLIGKIKEIVT